MMSIHVNDFKYEPGKNDAKYIALLEKTLKQEQAVTAKAVAKVRTQAKEIENIRNKTIDEFATAIKSSDAAWDWCCNDETNELCDASYCGRCMAEFQEKIDALANQIKENKNVSK